MSSAILWGVLFGFGALLLLTAQPIGAPRPSLAARLEALRPDRPYESSEPRVPVFRTPLFEQLLRPSLESAGSFILSAARRLGLDLKETATRLSIIGDPGGLGLFLGQKLASGVIGLAILPAAFSMGLLDPTPPWTWLAAGIAAFIAPDFILRSKAEKRQVALREGLARFADLVSLSVSAGLGLEGALEEVASAAEGPFFVELRRHLRTARLQGEPASRAISSLAGEMKIAEAQPLAGALGGAESHGIAVSQVLKAQARSIRERRRLELVQAGEKAQVRMALPVGLFILPAFFILLLYPAAVQLLQITAQ